MRARLLLIAGFLMVACGDDDGGPRSLTLKLTFDQQQMTCDTCSDVDSCPLDCEGEIGLYLVDANDDSIVIDSKCIDIVQQAGQRLRSLPELLAGTDFVNGITTGREVRLEIAVYSKRTTNHDCPRPFVGPDGNPAPVADEVPSYYGRSEAVTIGSSGVTIDLPVGCFFGGTGSCDQTIPEVPATTYVNNLFSSVTTDDQTAMTLVVALGSLFIEPGLAQFALQDMLDREIGPFWQKTLEFPMYDPFCVATLVNKIGPGGGIPLVSCNGTLVYDAADQNLVLIETTGYYMDKARIDAVLASLALTDVPATGLLIGRVVNGAGNPVEGATVRPRDGTATVIYLDSNFSVVSGSGTVGDAWFVVKDPPSLSVMSSMGEIINAPCCEYFEAELPQLPLPPLIGCSPGRLGIIDGVVMLGPINVDSGPCPLF